MKAFNLSKSDLMPKASSELPTPEEVLRFTQVVMQESNMRRDRDAHLFQKAIAQQPSIRTLDSEPSTRPLPGPLAQMIQAFSESSSEDLGLIDLPLEN